MAEGALNYEAHTARISHLANEMVRLFVSGHNAQQTAEYTATQGNSLQSMTDAALSQVFIPPQKKSHLNVG